MTNEITNGSQAGERVSSGWFSSWQNLLLLLLVAWLLLSQSYGGATNPASAIKGWDFRVPYDAAVRINTSQALYNNMGGANGTPPYVYTPLVAMAFRPLAHLSLDRAIQVWFLVSAACLILSVIFFARASGIEPGEVVPLCIMLIVGFRFWPMVFNFGLGQVNNLLLVCVCGMFWAEKRGKPALAGLLIALAALVKIWIIGILIYPLVRKNWKMAVWSVVFYCAGLAAVFVPFGKSEFLRFVTVTLHNTEQKHLLSQSIVGFARLYFAPNPHVNALFPNPAFYYGFIAFGYLLVGGAFVYLWSRRGGPRTPREARLWFGLCLLSIPLVSPLCHDEYFILALPLLWTLLTRPRCEAGSKGLSWSFAASLILYALLMRPWPTSGDGLAAHRSGLGSLLASSFFLLGAALWFCGLFSIIKIRTDTAKAPAGQSLPASLPVFVPSGS